MNRTLFTIIALSLAACHSEKSVSTVNTEETDFTETRTETILSATADSLFRSLKLSFDTLDVWLEDKPLATLPEDEHSTKRVRLRAVRGSLASSQQQTSSSQTAIIVADTASVAHSDSRASQESATTTAVYSPPDLTWLFGIAFFLLAAATVVLYILRYKS